MGPTGYSGAAWPAGACPGRLVAPGRMRRCIRFAWIAVMLVFEHVRECPSPGCCRGQQIGQAFKCCADGTAGSTAFGMPGGNVREHFELAAAENEDGRGSLAGLGTRRLVWCAGFLPANPVAGIAAEIRRGAAGEVWCLVGGVAAAVTVRVAASGQLPEAGAETTSRPISGERL